MNINFGVIIGNGIGQQLWKMLKAGVLRILYMTWTKIAYPKSWELERSKENPWEDIG